LIQFVLFLVRFQTWEFQLGAYCQWIYPNSPARKIRRAEKSRTFEI
jgi:hypothetical protein